MTDYKFLHDLFRQLKASGDITPNGDFSPKATREVCSQFALEIPQEFENALSSWSQELMTYYLQANTDNTSLAYERLGRRLTMFVNEYLVDNGCPFRLSPLDKNEH